MARQAAPQAPAQAPAVPTVNPWLRFARNQAFPVQIGTLPAGQSGGTAADFITLNPNNVPEVPAFCYAIDMVFTVPLQVVTPAANTTYRLSAYAPYSGFSVQMILSGSPEWPSNVSLVPFWLDELVNSESGFDPFMTGPNLRTTNQLPLTDAPNWFDGGPLLPSFSLGADTIFPGASFNNGAAPTTKHYKFQFTARIRLQRRLSQMWGMIPLGDPQNRPVLRLQLNSIIGNQPENCWFTTVLQAGTAPVGTVDTGGIAVNVIFRTKSLDILPQGLSQLPQPVVGMGLNLTYDNSFGILQAGSIVYQYQRTAQIYEAIHQIFVNSTAGPINPQPFDPEYWGLWLTQNQATARTAYDSAAGTMQDYYEDNKRKYLRNFPLGHLVWDLANGELPDFPRETPYVGLMSPDAGYAAMAGVAATPNMSTAWRVPAATTLVSAYTGIYSFGWVKVPY